MNFNLHQKVKEQIQNIFLRLPRWIQVLVGIFALGYLIVPTDAVPDVLLGVGSLDDLAVGVLSIIFVKLLGFLRNRLASYFGRSTPTK